MFISKLQFTRRNSGFFRMSALAKMHSLTAFCLMILTASATTQTLRADEGMWLFNALPREQLLARHGFEPDAAWLGHVQKASVRFNNGGSGAFVSADGLVITNHHVAADALYKLSSSGRDYLAGGFHARTRDEELKCVDLELNVLMSVEDVTAQVNAAVRPDMDAAGAFAARRAAKASIEKAALEKTGLRSDVVTLYQGAEYHLYQYKRYTDIRLVFAPEQQAAAFGGDPDNFEFPRYDLDCAFVRVYENGKPAQVKHFLKWSANGSVENELVFVSGHPGNTSRSLTADELAYLRDVRIPLVQNFLKANEVLLLSWGARSLENARRARDDLGGIQNSRKVYDGRAAALLDPAFMRAKKAEDAGLRAFAATRPELADAPGAWDEIAAAQAGIAKNLARYSLLEAWTLNSKLAGIARVLVRSAEENAKPNGERLREYRDSDRASLELGLFSGEPIYADYETLKAAQFLTFAAQQLGFDDPSVQIFLGGQSPADRAAALVNGTKLRDVAERRRLYAMTPAEIAAEAGRDPLLALMLAIDTEARAVRKIMEEQNEIREQAHAKIARVRYARHGASVYPDATFTLRLSFGTVKGYEEQGRRIAPYTTIAGTYARSVAQQNRPPYDLPASWVAAKNKIDPDTPFNFVSTCDIIGGNSGSPVINRRAEYVGLVFDGNMQSLAGDYYYDGRENRAVSVDSRAIIEALAKIYDAEELAAELRTGACAAPGK